MINKQVSGKSFAFFEWSLLAALFLCMFDLAAGGSFFLMEISLLVFGFCFLYYLVDVYSLSPRKIFHTIKGRLAGFWLPVLLLLLYLGWELFTLIYSGYRSGLFEKYKVVLLMLFLATALILYATDANRIDKVLKTIMASGVFSACFSFLNYAVFRIWPIYYGKRLSLRLDYNVFAVVIMMGLISGFFFIVSQNWPVIKESVLLILLVSSTVTAVLLSSSRRSYLIVTALCVLFFVNYMAHALLQLRKGEGRAPLAVLATAAATVFLVSTLSALLGQYMASSYDALLQSESGKFLTAGESSALERYGTMDEAGGSKRSVIWGIALDELQGYSPIEALDGKGFGHDRALYQQVDSLELEQAYSPKERVNLSAHSFVLADLLNGGWIQLGLSLSIWVGIGVMLLIVWRAYPIFGQLYIAAFSLIFVDNIISNRFGFAYDKYFWIFLSLLLAEIRLIRLDCRRCPRQRREWSK